MLTTKNLVSKVDEVPSEWVMATYCGLPLEQFDGNDFKIRSVFQEERTPSMGFYVKDGKYRFNDFSSGNKGNQVDLVKALFGLDGAAACRKIVSDFNVYRLKSNGEQLSIRAFKQNSRYKVTDFKIREWNKLDQGYWTAYNIGTRLLKKYNIVPLESYSMTKEDNELTITGDYIYGYLREDGTLYKIYQPKAEGLKFIKVGDYTQGSGQVTGKTFLTYTSSLKDIAALDSLGLDMDYKAPDSENTLISEATVKRDLLNYKALFILFDNDLAGQKAAQKYKEKFPEVKVVFLNYGEKDPSDHIKRFKPNKVKQWLVPLFDKYLNTN